MFTNKVGLKVGTSHPIIKKCNYSAMGTAFLPLSIILYVSMVIHDILSTIIVSMPIYHDLVKMSPDKYIL